MSISKLNDNLENFPNMPTKTRQWRHHTWINAIYLIAKSFVNEILKHKDLKEWILFFYLQNELVWNLDLARVKI